MPEYTPTLYRTAAAVVEPDGAIWLPIAAWADYPNEAGTGFPWQLETTHQLITQGGEWDYLAFTAHFLTGLHDVYEHTFDNWDRIDFCEQMLAVDYRLDEAADALAINREIANQFLMYRTLHTRVPLTMLGYLSRDYLGEPYGIAVETLPARALAAFPETASECVDDFAFPTPLVSLFEADAELTVRCVIPDNPAQNSALARLLDYALTCGLLSWNTLFQEANGVLTFQPESLALLRSKMEADDPTGRVGSLAGGRCSDESLRLLIRARLQNLVGPSGLWAALGLPFPEEKNWQLRVPAIYSPGYERSDEKINSK